jgi:hypothetical protein
MIWAFVLSTLAFAIYFIQARGGPAWGILQVTFWVLGFAFVVGLVFMKLFGLLKND